MPPHIASAILPAPMMAKRDANDDVLIERRIFHIAASGAAVIRRVRENLRAGASSSAVIFYTTSGQWNINFPPCLAGSEFTVMPPTKIKFTPCAYERRPARSERLNGIHVDASTAL